ncbi:hypothetical protein [Nostoc sp. PA-18-2419]|nr:hypothetical protein [Nostoc sp. PA-18-2419]
MPKDDKSEVSCSSASEILGYDDFLFELKTQFLALNYERQLQSIEN